MIKRLKLNKLVRSMVDHLKCSSSVTFINFRLKKPNLTNEDEIK